MDENENLILIGANCIDEWQMWRVLAGRMSNVVVFGGRKQFPDSRLSILAVSSVRAGAGEWRVVTGISRVSSEVSGTEAGRYSEEGEPDYCEDVGERL